MPMNHFSPVILAGGQGTRLRSVVSDRPKIMATVSGRPFVTYLLDRLQNAGFKKVTLSIGYMANMVKETLGVRYGELELDYVYEQTPLGTGGALRLAFDYLDQQPLLALNGDSFCSVDLKAYIYALPNDAIAGLALTQVSNSDRYGTVKFTSEGRVLEFKEKDSTFQSAWINAGIYLLRPEALSCIPPETNISLEKDIFPKLITKNLFAWPNGKEFIDIGLPETYENAEAFFEKVNLK